MRGRSLSLPRFNLRVRCRKSRRAVAQTVKLKRLDAGAISASAGDVDHTGNHCLVAVGEKPFELRVAVLTALERETCDIVVACVADMSLACETDGDALAGLESAYPSGSRHRSPFFHAVVKRDGERFSNTLTNPLSFVNTIPAVAS